MKARLLRDYSCFPNGVDRVSHRAGDIVDGQFAVYALSDGAAVENTERAPEVAKTPTPETTKRTRKGK